MYEPKGNGKEKDIQAVSFVEVEPPCNLRGIVHRFIELKTEVPLQDDYRFHALPDACTYIVFDQLQPNISGVTKLRASSEELNLGNKFHYLNIRFLPGVWQVDKEPVSYGMVNSQYTGKLPLIKVNRELWRQAFSDKQSIMIELVEKLVANKLVVANPVTEKIFRHIHEIHSVSDMAVVSGISTRQLQRTLKRTTGFTPHDFLKILRLQQALGGKHGPSYADQSHFIHSFRKATGYTPSKYSQKFDV